MNRNNNIKNKNNNNNNNNNKNNNKMSGHRTTLTSLDRLWITIIDGPLDDVVCNYQ